MGAGSRCGRAKGRQILFRSDDNQIMVASYEVAGGSFQPDKPRLWSSRRLANVNLNGTYDLAPDGKRIAALMPAETAEGQEARSHVVFVKNFFDELRRVAPAMR